MMFYWNLILKPARAFIVNSFISSFDEIVMSLHSDFNKFFGTATFSEKNNFAPRLELERLKSEYFLLT